MKVLNSYDEGICFPYEEQEYYSKRSFIGVIDNVYRESYGSFYESKKCRRN